MSRPLFFVILGLLPTSAFAQVAPCPQCHWEYAFPPRVVIHPAGKSVPREVYLRRTEEAEKLRRMDDEIKYLQTEIDIIERRLCELDTMTRFKHSYGFTLDQDQHRLGLLRSQQQLEALKRIRSEFLRTTFQR